MRKKRLNAAYFAVAAILAVLTSVQYALADVEIFSGNALPGYKYNTSIGEEFSVIYGSSKEKIIVDFPSESIIIENQSCSEGNTFKGCYWGATFHGYNISLPDREVYNFNLRLSLLAPRIEIGKLVEKPEVDAGEETVVRVNITNSGSKPAAVYFSETIPSTMKLVELPNQPCQLSANNALVLSTEIRDGEQKHCDYKVSAQVPGTYFLVSNANYDILKTEKATASSTLIVNMLPFSFNMTSKRQLLLGEKVNITFQLNSTKQIDAFAFSTLVPSYLKSALITKGAEGRKTADGFEVSYGDKISSFDGSLELKVSSEATSVGLFTISAKADWTHNGSKQGISADFPVNVTLASPYLRTLKYDAGTGKASIDIVNPAHLPIFRVSVASEDFFQNQSLISEQVNSVGHASFDAVLAQASGNYTGTITYYTEYGQKLATTSKLAINASSAKKVELQKTEEGNITADSTSPPASGENSSKPGITSSSEVRVGVFMVAIIVIIIVAFFIVRAKRKPAYYSEY